jgi:ribokinase
MDALIFGSIIMDVIVYSDKVKSVNSKGKKYLGLDYGSKIEIDKLNFSSGGSGHNIAIGLARLGRKVSLIGSIGKDVFGKEIVNELKKNKVDLNFVSEIKETTGSSLVVIGKNKERSILINRGANNFVSSIGINENNIKKFRWFVFTSVIGNKSITVLKKAVDIAKKHNIKVVANPSISMIKYKRKELKGLVKKSDIIIVNEEEAFELSGTNKVDKALIKLRKIGPSIVVITLGKKGVVGFDGKNKYRQKTYKVRVSDTTGAGDCFTAGFLHSLMKNNDIKRALKFGAATAALNLKTYGAVNNFPSENEINKLARR